MDNSIVSMITFNRSRGNLLLVVIFSAINLFLTIIDAGVTFLFTAILPMFAIELGKAFSDQSNNENFYVIGVVVAVIAILIYLAFYLLSKKYRGFLVGALVFFIVDTLFLIWLLQFGFDFSFLLSIIFHAYVLYYLIIGVKAWWELRNLPKENNLK